MRKVKNYILMVLMLLPVVLTGCSSADKEVVPEINQTLLEKLEALEKGQQDILAKVNVLETNQKQIMKGAPASAPKRPSVDVNKVHELTVGSSAIKGKKDAAVTITEFSDFQCPYCARLQPTLNQVLNAFPNDVRLVFKDFPLSFHKQAKNAAKAARAAGEQDKYWEMHDLIFADFNKLTDESYKAYATKLQLDVEKFMASYQSNKYDKMINDDIAMGRNAGVTGTPTLFMNGKRMMRRSFEDFKSEIEGYLKK
ncbi:MAG: thioredoxin domain-containing protein [Nitrospira sp.]|nr:thioredoxin domain-containing protein [bacterium]MBL7048869.1 thioredoxin domain-containing protein [Nitrospira sp.]